MYLLCPPEFKPHMTGGVIPELVTLKVSVRHCVARDCSKASASFDNAPFKVFTADAELVCGPVMINVEKSRRSCKRRNVQKIQSNIYYTFIIQHMYYTMGVGM